MTDFDDPLIGNDPTVGNGDHIERPARSTSPLEGGLMDLVTYYGSFVPTLRPEQTMRLPTIDDATALAREVLELREEVAELRKRDFLALAREGGLARTRNQTPERLSEIGRKGGKARAAGRKAESNDA